MEHIPLIRIGPIVLVPIQADLTDRKAEAMQEDILNKIERENIQYILLDVSALEMVDSFIIRILYDTARMSHIMNARVVVVGMQPAVTLTLLEMGFDLEGIETAIDVEVGLKRLGYAMLPLTETGDGQESKINEYPLNE